MNLFQVCLQLSDASSSSSDVFLFSLIIDEYAIMCYEGRIGHFFLNSRNPSHHVSKETAFPLLSSVIDPMKSLQDYESKQNLRLIGDIRNDPVPPLSSICGHEDYPLVLLEEPYKHFLRFIKDSKRYVWIAKQNSKTPHDALIAGMNRLRFIYILESGQILYIEN